MGEMQRRREEALNDPNAVNTNRSLAQAEAIAAQVQAQEQQVVPND